VVGGFNTFKARSAVAEILKVLGVAEFQVRRFTERFPWGRTGDLPELLRECRECGDLPIEEEPYASALRLAAFLDGFPRHAKMHPCGVVISRIPIHAVTPTFMSDKGYPTTHFDMDACEAAGLVKMDILAQGGLAVLRDVKAGLGGGERPPGEPWDDARIWELIASGNARGVHHIESPAMISLSRMCCVNSIDQLVAIVSVIRPGAANNLKKQTFARRCQGLEPVEYAHPSLEGVLRSTYGVVAYEEHILQICESFAGLPAGRADVLRRALVKEKKAVIREILAEFEVCARARGRSEDEITVVRGLVEGFQGYAFCRAHSTAYALEAYEAAWFKSRHPAHFLAGVLTHGKGFYSRLVYTLEARRLGVGFLRPDINDTHEGFHVEETDGRECIRVPITAIGGLSSRTLEAWRRGRPFASLDDFISRVPAEFAEIQSLIRTGCFDGFGRKRAAQYWQASARVMEAGMGETLDFELVSLPPAERLADTPRSERLDAEWELLGFTVEEHPLERWPWIDWSGYRPVAGLGDSIGAEVLVCGLVVNERLHDQADDRLMKFVLIADRSGMLECELFADAYERWGAVIARNPVVALRGIVEPFDNRKGWTLRVTGAEAPAGAADSLDRK
jgi:DNA polymerase III alpha subunit